MSHFATNCIAVVLILLTLSALLGPPSRIHSKLHAFLVDQPLWEEMEPDPTLTVATIIVVLIITFSTILVRYKLRNRIGTATTTTSNRFENPFKNVNFIIIIINLTYTMLQKMFFDIERFPLLMFPRFSVGLYITPVLGLFLLGNPAIQEHAVKSILSFLPSCFEGWTSPENVIQIQNYPANSNNLFFQTTLNGEILRKQREMDNRLDQTESNEINYSKFTGHNVVVHGEESKINSKISTNHMEVEDIEKY